MGKELALLTIICGLELHYCISSSQQLWKMGDNIYLTEIETKAERGSSVHCCIVKTRQNRDHNPGLSDAKAHDLSALPCCPLLNLLIPNELESLNHKVFLKVDEASVSHSPRIQRKRICNRFLNTICTQKKSHQFVQSSLAKLLSLNKGLVNYKEKAKIQENSNYLD